MCSCKFITATPQVQSTAAIKEENSGNDGGGEERGQPVGETEAHLREGEGPEVVGPPATPTQGRKSGRFFTILCFLMHSGHVGNGQFEQGRS